MHHCSWETVSWDNAYVTAGFGECLNRIGVCRVCGRTIRETYTLVGHYDKETDEPVDLTDEGE